MFTAEGCGELLQRGEASLARGEAEGLCVGGLPPHPRQVHQHVRRPRRAEEHEELGEERLCHVSAGGPVPQGHRGLAGHPGVTEPLHVPGQAGQH